MITSVQNAAGLVVGDRVIVKNNAGFSAGSKGIVKGFQNAQRAYVLREGESEPARGVYCWWLIDELEIDPMFERPAAVRLAQDGFDATAVALGISRDQVQADMAKVFTLRDDAVILDADGYESLARVLARAFSQAAHGKGKERHAADGEPFDKQVMQEGANRFGVGALLFQAFKKSEESQRLALQPAVRELLGAINYLAGAVIALEKAGH